MANDGAFTGSIMTAVQLAPEPAPTRFSSSHQPAFGPKRPRHGGTLRCLCPHCDAQAAVRSSERLTLLVKELRYQCSNLECGHTFLATLTIERTIVQSARPRPSVKLPIGQPRPRAPANDT